MKKNLIKTVIVAAATFAGVSGVSAQKLSNTGTSVYQKSIGLEIDKMVSTAKDPGNGNVAISPKALRNFSRTYGNVAGEIWGKVKGGFSVRFNSDGLRTTIFYDDKGRWAGSLKHYTEDKMPAGMRDMVKSKYYDYSIVYVQEVETIDSNKIPTYIVCVEDKSTIKFIRLFEGDMSLWKELVRAN